MEFNSDGSIVLTDGEQQVMSLPREVMREDINIFELLDAAYIQAGLSDALDAADDDELTISQRAEARTQRVQSDKRLKALQDVAAQLTSHDVEIELRRLA